MPLLLKPEQKKKILAFGKSVVKYAKMGNKFINSPATQKVMRKMHRVSEDAEFALGGFESGLDKRRKNPFSIIK